MNILLETPYYNCSLAFVGVKLNDQDHFECLAVANSGWLSCERPLSFSRNDGKKFVDKIKKYAYPLLSGKNALSRQFCITFLCVMAFLADFG